MAANAYCLLAARVYTSHTHVTPRDVHPFRLSPILLVSIRASCRSRSIGFPSRLHPIATGYTVSHPLSVWPTGKGPQGFWCDIGHIVESTAEWGSVPVYTMDMLCFNLRVYYHFQNSSQFPHISTTTQYFEDWYLGVHFIHPWLRTHIVTLSKRCVYVFVKELEQMT